MQSGSQELPSFPLDASCYELCISTRWIRPRWPNRQLTLTLDQPGQWLLAAVPYQLPPKVREIKHSGEASRPVVLLGWGVGAAIAAHVAGIEKLAGLVCLGFPVATLAGPRCVVSGV